MRPLKRSPLPVFADEFLLAPMRISTSFVYVPEAPTGVIAVPSIKTLYL